MLKTGGGRIPEGWMEALSSHPSLDGTMGMGMMGWVLIRAGLGFNSCRAGF